MNCFCTICDVMHLVKSIFVINFPNHHGGAAIMWNGISSVSIFIGINKSLDKERVK